MHQLLRSPSPAFELVLRRLLKARPHRVRGVTLRTCLKGSVRSVADGACTRRYCTGFLVPGHTEAGHERASHHRGERKQAHADREEGAGQRFWKLQLRGRQRRRKKPVLRGTLG